MTARVNSGHAAPRKLVHLRSAAVFMTAAAIVTAVVFVTAAAIMAAVVFMTPWSS